MVHENVLGREGLLLSDREDVLGIQESPVSTSAISC